MSGCLAGIGRGMERCQECMERERSSCFVLPRCYGAVLHVALAVLAVVGTTGVVPGMAVGWTAVGVGAVLGVLLVCGRCKQKTIDYVIHGIAIAALLLIGFLGGSGALSGVQVGGAILGIQGALAGLVLLRPFLACRRRSRFHGMVSPFGTPNSFFLPQPRRWRGVK